MSTILVVNCHHCGSEVEKTLGNVNRAKNNGGKLYCDIDCATLEKMKVSHVDNVVLNCATCGNEFSKSGKEYRRQVKNGRSDFYCSISCAGKRKENLARMSEMCKASAIVFNISDYAGNRADEFTGLREHLRRAQQRKDKYEGLTLEHLLEVWERQEGRCAYTGVELAQPLNCGGNNGVSKNYLASLDRIDSGIGYRNGNVQFVSVTVNRLKNDMSEEEVIDFFDIVKGIRRRDLISA